MNTTQKQEIMVTEADALGNPVTVNNANLKFELADPTVASISTDASGNSFVVGTTVGATVLTVTDPPNNLTGTVEVTVTAVGVGTDAPTSLAVTLGPAEAA